MYNPKIIEPKWQKFWEEKQVFATKNPSTEEDFSTSKYYVLDMFPYPSGTGLHVGHPKGYIASDIVSRYKHNKGFRTLHTMGWDSFGLPAENYAIKTGVHPKVTTDENIANLKRQLQDLGFSYDWSREIATTDPLYYKWTQWIFLKLFEAGLAYEQDLPINYCPSCKTGLANEEVVGNNLCDRCGTQVERRKIRQWVLAITKYADRLLNDVDRLDWPEGIKEMQRNWIGKSEGCEFEMKKSDDDTKSLSVYTTRVDTVFGMTYAVLAPDHPNVNDFITDDQSGNCLKYITESKNKSDQDRTNEGKEKTGVFTGSYVVNPFNGKKIPVWIGDYVLGSYGTGAVMAVPAHDERDFAFAKKYDLPIKQSVDVGVKFSEEIWNPEYANDGGVIDMRWGENLMTSNEARNNFSELAEKEGFGKKKVNYKLRDWLFSRQRYWGEPIPLIHLAIEDIEKLPKIEHKKNEICIPTSRIGHDDLAKISFASIIFESIHKVKKKRKNIHLHSIDTIIKTEKGNIRFSGKEILEHFNGKHVKEFHYRKALGFTVLGAITHLVYESELVGYFVYKNHVIRVVLGKDTGGGYFVKTYYLSETRTKLFNKAYIKVREDSEYLYIQGKEYSKIYDGLYGKIICDYKLPLELPEVQNYEPAGDGNSPLSLVPEFVNVKLADNLNGKRETNTMPQWAGSCWYYLRFMDPSNDEFLVNPELVKYWGEVDSYVGGAEHAVLHLLYARFWHKFLFDIGVVPTDEPFYRLHNQGMILAYAFEREHGGLVAVDLVEERDGNFYEISTGKEVKRIVAKMSKSLKNVVNPDTIIEKYGTDTLRLHEMYMSDFKDSAPWDTDAIIGVRRFLEKASNLFETPRFAVDDMKAMKLLHKTIKKVGEDIEAFKFNTAISSLMILVNEGLPRDQEMQMEWKEKFAILLHPFAPHLAEELWGIIHIAPISSWPDKMLSELIANGGYDNKNSVYNASWPEYQEFMLVDDEVTIAIQVNGKLRGTHVFLNGVSQEEVASRVMEDPEITKWLDGLTVAREIFVPNKLYGIVAK